MPPKPTIAIIGPGRLGSTLALALNRSGYKISEIIHSGRPSTAKKAKRLARSCRARVARSDDVKLDAGVFWFCVPDRSIRAAAEQLAKAVDWHGKIALHASGALASDELGALRQRGASVASAHPLMTFVTRSQPALAGVPFAIEGDARAAKLARHLVRALGGTAFPVEKRSKAAYHTWGAFTSPLLIALLTTGEEVARSAGISAGQVRRLALPILRQTLENYARLGPADAFSGPIVRGDATTLRRHLKSLRRLPQARAVYLSLARAALQSLPAANKTELEKLLH
jgi:predicted short-subunit dehydrogenase-like oxidoreductase (DUF2520 family)